MEHHLRLAAHDARQRAPLVDADEAALGEALIAGHQEAHSVVWLRFQPLVARLARQSLPSSADVPDVVQEVFLCLLNCAYALKHPAALRSFIVSTTRFTIANYMKRSRRRTVEPLSERHAEILAVVPDPVAHQTMGRVLDVLRHFEALSRSVFLLRFIYGMDVPNISDLVGRSPATVKRRLAYVRRRLVSLVPREGRTGHRKDRPVDMTA
jgi:RNA polymerase sigma factor (sigma-70 family)